MPSIRSTAAPLLVLLLSCPVIAEEQVPKAVHDLVPALQA
jgi:hypothetical protein